MHCSLKICKARDGPKSSSLLLEKRLKQKEELIDLDESVWDSDYK